jgi:hypothetical protein
MAGIGHIHGIFGKNDGVVIGKRHTFTFVVFSGVGDHFGGCLFHQTIHILGFADIPVLTEFTGQVAAGGSEREHAGSRIKVIQGFLFYGIDTKSRGSSIGGQNYLIAFAHPHKAGASLPLMQFAIARAEVALYSVLVGPMPVFGEVLAVLHHAEQLPSSGTKPMLVHKSPDCFANYVPFEYSYSNIDFVLLAGT